MSPDNYTWNAKDYAENSTAQQSWARELMSKLELKGNETIMDIGCGDGKITAELASRVPNGNVTGIDSSLSMIKMAKATFPSNKWTNLYFRKMDAVKLHFDEEFDVVFSNAVLHWVKDQHAVLSGIFRSLKKGGKILLQMGGRGNAADLFDIVKIMGREELWLPYLKDVEIPYTFCAPEEYSQWLLDTGFCPDYVHLLDKDMVHKGMEGLSGWLRPVSLPYTDRLPGTLHSDFIDELIGRYLQHHPLDKEGMSHVRMVRLEVAATKC